MDARERAWLWAGAAGAVLFSACAMLVLSGLADALDAPTALALDSPHSALVDAATILSLVGGTIGVGLAILVAAGVLVWQKRWWGAVRVLSIPIAGDTASDLLKLAFARARPADALAATDSFSFPSGHATSATILACLVVWFAFSQPRGRAAVALLVAVGAGWAIAQAGGRLVLRVHYATDVLGGIGLGLAVAAVGLVVSVEAQRRWNASRNDWRP